MPSPNIASMAAHLPRQSALANSIISGPALAAKWASLCESWSQIPGEEDITASGGFGVKFWSRILKSLGELSAELQWWYLGGKNTCLAAPKIAMSWKLAFWSIKSMHPFTFPPKHLPGSQSCKEGPDLEVQGSKICPKGYSHYLSSDNNIFSIGWNVKNKVYHTESQFLWCSGYSSSHFLWRGNKTSQLPCTYLQRKHTLADVQRAFCACKTSTLLLFCECWERLAQFLCWRKKSLWWLRICHQFLLSPRTNVSHFKVKRVSKLMW